MYSLLKRIKSRTDRLLGPYLMHLRVLGVKPAHLTLLSLLFGVLGVALLFDSIYGAVFVFAYITFDFLDGLYARATDTATESGAKLDFLVDRIVVLLFAVKYYLHSGRIFFSAGIILVVFIISVGDRLRE